MKAYQSSIRFPVMAGQRHPDYSVPSLSQSFEPSCASERLSAPESESSVYLTWLIDIFCLNYWNTTHTQAEQVISGTMLVSFLLISFIEWSIFFPCLLSVHQEKSLSPIVQEFLHRLWGIIWLIHVYYIAESTAAVHCLMGCSNHVHWVSRSVYVCCL